MCTMRWGRRTEKQHISPDGKPYNRTTFLWDGMWLAQESRPEGTDSLYIYRDPGSYEPLARVDKAGKRGPEPDTVFSHGCERRAGRDDGQ